MKYILNESSVRTTNGFNINNVKIDLDVPNTYVFHDYKYNNINELIINDSIKENFSSKIGLSHDVYKDLTITLGKCIKVEELFDIKYEFDDNDNLIDNININLEENSKLNMILRYDSLNNLNKNFHNGNLNITLNKNSELNLTILNNISLESVNMLSSCINCYENSKLNIVLLDLKGNIRLYNFESKVYKNAKSNLDNIYIGKNNNLIDINYNYINLEENSNSNIEIQGVLLDKAKKAFKGIIDFKRGSSNSIGRENENCLLLSEESISKSLPILLCEEENVEGAHSVSSGKIDDNKLFYLMSRGISNIDAKKLIILANFETILNKLPKPLDDDVRNMINELV